MLIADLHIHSRYSRGCSRDLSPETLWRWSQLKGIGVVGTGDFTHPGWIAELQDKLESDEGGLLKLRPGLSLPDVYSSCRADVRFLLTSEISCIYRRHDRTRKVHLVLLAPDFPTVARINAALAGIGNLASDGRPILGLDAYVLLEMMLSISPDIMVIPAHAWTPHFSVFGAFSGFDSLEECFGDLTPHIRAIETGLSSDPAMNRRIPALDGIQLISCSDAHSPAKLGREATFFDCPPSYAAITAALATGDGLAGTIEFFPQEGKYYLDGHRDCGICLEPEQTRACGGRCPKCGGKLTVGVLHRVEELASRTVADQPDRFPPFESLVPLVELISSIAGFGTASKRVQAIYFTLLERLGSEFYILREASEDAIAAASSQAVATAIVNMRRGIVSISPGYDGKFGRVMPVPA
ncbi:MAG: DNA helicase UvrD [Desulfuromonadales bacterium]|nr:DNA helicase UvrD [Desulfuromonadales bacterium]